MQDKRTDTSKKTFISYVDDDGEIKNAFVIILERDVNSITFQTNKNIITIPIARLVKLKQEVDNNANS